MRRRYEDIPGHPDQLAAEAERWVNTIDEKEEGPRVGAVKCGLPYLTSPNGLKHLKEFLGMDIELVVLHERRDFYLVIGTASGFDPLDDPASPVPLYEVTFHQTGSGLERGLSPGLKTNVQIRRAGNWRPLSEVHPNTLYTSRVDLDALAARRNEGQIEP